MERHAEDLLAVLDHLDLPAVPIAGHSMGGFVAAAFVAGHARRTTGTVLVDGGLPFPPLPEGVTTEQALSATIGPAAARLTMTFPSTEAYLDYWRPHPALAGHWTRELEAYLAYDLDGDRSSVSLDAVREDSEDLLGPGRSATWAERLPDGTLFLRAPRGMMDDAGGLYAEALVEQHRRSYPGVVLRDVPDTNHYTVVMSEPGAQAVADALDQVSGRMDR
jgi:pimeloyl-ACP methyl ester carboxylesterase